MEETRVETEMVKRRRTKVMCNKEESASIDALIVGNSKNKVSLKQDKELAATASRILNKNIASFAIARRRNKLAIAPWRGSIKKVVAKRAYVRSDAGNDVRLIMLTVKMYGLLKKIAKRLHAI